MLLAAASSLAPGRSAGPADPAVSLYWRVLSYLKPYTGLLVAGDAAGLLDPWTREGISFALRSGALAGAAAAGDIGEMFADTDPANRDRDSIGMLQAATQMTEMTLSFVPNAFRQVGNGM